ncbi:ATP-binding protein [Paractinoplanes rhizophilus]|uniref:ATP-binding protein n=1 Tax=Paractinoplanes rhizophilus TaxID=1416877 RepID=A0ABW2HT68_9ACTN
MAEGSEGAFVESLKELRRWAGQPSLRRLRQLGGTVRAVSGHEVPALPPSTVSSVLRRPELPRLEFVEAFVTACLRARDASPEEIRAALDDWRASWRAAGTAGADGPAGVKSEHAEAPHQLPADLPEFTGRDEHVRFLIGLAGEESPGAPQVAVIEGMAGVGKTRLAVHVAHALAEAGRYDAFLFLPLRGYTVDQTPTEPAAALETLLRSLGVDGREIPGDPDARATMYRDRLHGTRTLLLLDDAADGSQVTSLLPASGTCLVLVTSRRSLALDGAHAVRVNPFSTRESADLLARVAGAVRIAADPAGTAETARRCGNLPLAVALAGRRLQSRPAWSIADLEHRLRDSDEALDQFAAGDRSVRAAFQLSYDALPEDHRLVFRLLSLHPGDSFTAATAGELTGVRGAGTILEALVDEHLLLQPSPGRYSFHDLLRVYASERARADSPAGQRSAATTRILRWYLAVAVAADRVIDPHHRHVTVEPELAGVAPPFRNRADAIAWTTAEYGALTAAVSIAADTGAVSIAWRLAAALWSYFYLGKHLDDWIRAHEVALAAARRAGDLEGQAWMLNNLGVAHWQRRDYPAAIDRYRQARELRRAMGDHAGEIVLLDNLGNAFDEIGRADEAIDCYQQALTLAQRSGGPADRASVLHNLGEAYRRTGRYTDAGRCLTDALAIQQDLHDAMQRYTLCSLGELHDDLGDPRTAETYYERSRVLAEQVSDVWLTAVLWEKLGHTAALRGEDRAAEDLWIAAADTYAKVNDDEAAERVRRLLPPR